MITQRDQIALVCTAVGFKEVQKILTSVDSDMQPLVFTLSFNSYLEDVIITGYGSEMITYSMGVVYNVKREKIQKKKAVALEPSPIPGNLYPNPAKPGSFVSIPFDKAGKVGWRIVDVSGKVFITQHAISIQAGQLQQVFLPASMTAGQYFVQILDANGKTSTTSKLVVIR